MRTSCPAPVSSIPSLVRWANGTGWMPEQCASCEFKEIDFGGCRCQAFALTGNAGNTDPACTLSSQHEQTFKLAEQEAAADNKRFIYRNFAGGTLERAAIMAPDAKSH
jgi:pyrroloquinoline quinone biosynthesis protein E